MRSTLLRTLASAWITLLTASCGGGGGGGGTIPNWRITGANQRIDFGS